MAIFVDSADPDDARRAQALGFVGAVTTNPSLVAKVGRPALELLHELLEIFDGPVFYQVTAETVAGRADQAWEAYRVAPQRVVVKIPAASENLPLAKELAAAGMMTCVTAVCSAAQAYLAAQVQARYVAPYVNRLTRQLGDGVAVVRDMAAILRGTQTEILAASLKAVQEAEAALLAGAHHITVPLDLIVAMGEHEFSQQAIAEFDAAVRSMVEPAR